MARVVKEQEYAARRGEILDVAQQLVATRGYEQMAIQDILGAMQISKGAFYHYFGSKHALLEALVDRQLAEAEQRLAPIVRDPELTALAKFERFFATINNLKIAQKAFLIELLRVWHADGNALMRQKIRAAALSQLAPLVSAMVGQGLAEGVLNTTYPDQVGVVVVCLAHDFGDIFAAQLLAHEPAPAKAQRMEQTLAVYVDAIERVLGAPPGSMTIADAATMREWADAVEGTLI